MEPRDRAMTTLVEYPSPFPVERRLVTYWNASPRIFVDWRITPADEMLWISRIDAIIRTRAEELGRNVLIQSVSYKRARTIMQMSRYASRMIWNDSSDDSAEAIERFRQRAGTGAVLVSPSMGTGVNFPDDECRCIIIPKFPYPDMRSPIMRRIQKEDPEQRSHMMVKALQQACGRGNRHPDDWCETLLIDAHWVHAQHEIRRHGAKYFVEALRSSSNLPPPLLIKDGEGR